MNALAHSTAHQNLRTLCLIRLIPLGGLSLASLYLYLAGKMPLSWAPIVVLLILFVAQIAFSWWRSGRSAPISDRYFFAQLVADVALFGLLLYFTGGASNPFVSYFLVPITIAAITLPRRYTVLTGALSLAAYTALLFWFVEVPDLAPIQAHHHSEAGELNMHIIGMWLNFFASALLIIWFVTRMAEAVRVRDEALIRQQAAATQQRLQDEQLLAVATLAASAAHDLGTPLNTVKLIVDDWRLSDKGKDNVPGAEEQDIIASQIHRCQQTLKKLADTARAFSQQQAQATTARQYFDDLLDRWLLMRPDAKVTLSTEDNSAGQTLCLHPSLAASIHNLLNNAADASPQRVDIHLAIEPDRAHLTIRDHGTGIDPARLQGSNSLGESGKTDGLGLGLFLSRAILARHGATLELTAHSEGGTVASIELPLNPGASAQHSKSAIANSNQQRIESSRDGR